MTAKRLGSILSNVTGTAGQLLRVKGDESGFEFVTPTTIPSYTITNDTQDRALDCNDTTVDELADVVGTLIKDLNTIGNAGPGYQTVYESAEVTYSNDPNYGQTLTLNHNFGSSPDAIIGYMHDTISGKWIQIIDQFSSGGTAYGAHAIQETDLNNSRMTFWNLNFLATGVNIDKIKAKCFKLGIVANAPAFQWSSSEQVYPFEKAIDGSTLYCKLIACTVPNSGHADTAHNISGFVPSKVHSLKAILKQSGYSNCYMLPLAHPTSLAAQIMVYCDTNYIGIDDATNWSVFTCYVQLIYAK